MKTGSRSNALLVELLIVVMFFMLASTVLLQVFSGASDQGTRAGVTVEALNAAQNVADRLYAAEDPEALLTGLGFTQTAGGWERDDGKYRIHAVSNAEPRKEGVWRSQEVRVEMGEERLFTLPCSRYEEGAL